MIDLAGYLGMALMLAGGPVQLGLLLGVSRRKLAYTLILSLAVLLIPWSGHSVVYYLRGVAGDLSISSMVIVLLVNCRSLGFPLGSSKPFSWQAGLIPVAILLPLYSSTTGYLAYDLYSWGYQPQWLLLGVGVLLMYAWRTHIELAIAWLAGVVAFALGICPSVNLLDALFDPFMLFGGIGIMLRAAINLRRQSQSRNVKQPVYLQAA